MWNDALACYRLSMTQAVRSKGRRKTQSDHPAGRAARRLTVAVPAELVEPLERLARREDRSLSGQIVNIVRRHLTDEALLQGAIERANRGEVFTLPETGIEDARRAIAEGVSTDEVMRAFTGDAGGAGGADGAGGR
jgi:predicted transcriptional regulator